MDDNSTAFGSAVPLNGVTSVAPGQSVIFLEPPTPVYINGFMTAWFGATLQRPGHRHLWWLGVGLSTCGDAVNLFDPGGNRITGISFGTAFANATFDNKAGLGAPRFRCRRSRP